LRPSYSGGAGRRRIEDSILQLFAIWQSHLLV
jgi:hypothetical protein